MLLKKFLVFLLIFSLVGCATSISMRKISSLQLGMSKAEVVDKLGPPYLQRAAKQNSDGSIEEVWEYNNYNPMHESASRLTGNVTYWLRFINDKLYFYGHAGDFQDDSPKVMVQQQVVNK